jgi:hypothetical protein
MANRRIGSRGIRRHLTYTVAEAARSTGTHRNTVRHWLRSGLVAIDSRQPILIKGATLKAFIDARKVSRRQPCGPGRIYCLKCRAPKTPAFGEVEYEAENKNLGSLVGLCPDCATIIRRRTSVRNMRSAAANLTVRFRCEMERLGGMQQASLNCDSDQS